MHSIDLASYCIHATDPANAAQVEYECLGFNLAHEKAVELREAGFKNVVLSLGAGPEARETPAQKGLGLRLARRHRHRPRISNKAELSV
jgi:hypothetical protein